MSDMTKNLILWMVIAVVLMAVFNNFGTPEQQAQEINYSAFLSDVRAGRVDNVEIDGQKIEGVWRNGEAFRTYSPETNNSALIGDLLDHNVSIEGREPDSPSALWQIFLSWFPFLLLIGVWIYFMRQMQGGGAGGRGAFSFGKSKARLLGEDQVKVTFADVAGVEEAKEEVEELVDFLKEPQKFQRLGGTIPRGVLMVGPPGTGKTLLARAIAGEAKVPFFTISGSDFVEMFVGVGASRVRDMFEQAKKHAPCIIFIDEIDAVGRHRGAGMGGGHDEREQTLNQLLVEMDGFEGNEGVIVIAATNRPDVLDRALLRPGRFDRQVPVGLPDVRGREQILRVHMRKVPVADDVDPAVIARGTPGFSGADLGNLVNEAALLSARSNRRLVDMEMLEKAKDKIMMGAERRSMVMNEDEKRLTAYHESGHAIIGLSLEGHDPVHKVSIMPRGRALGVTMFLPEEDRYSHSRKYLEARLCSIFGGRLAEEMIFGNENVTTGASDDIERATEIARNMVTKWGLSDNLGPLNYSDDEQQAYLGQPPRQPIYSEETQQSIDKEVRGIIDRNYRKAREILEANMDTMHAMADALMKYETIDRTQIDAIMRGEEPPEPSDWSGGGPSAGASASGSGESAADDKAEPSRGRGSEEAPGPAS